MVCQSHGLVKIRMIMSKEITLFPGSLIFPPWSGEMRDPGNKVGKEKLFFGSQQSSYLEVLHTCNRNHCFFVDSTVKSHSNISQGFKL